MNVRLLVDLLYSTNQIGQLILVELDLCFSFVHFSHFLDYLTNLRLLPHAVGLGLRLGRRSLYFAEGLDVEEVSRVLASLFRGDAKVLPLPLCIFRLPRGCALGREGRVSAFTGLAPLHWDMWWPDLFLT